MTETPDNQTQAFEIGQVMFYFSSLQKTEQNMELHLRLAHLSIDSLQKKVHHGTKEQT